MVIHGLLIQLKFLSRIPVPVQYNEKAFIKGIPFLPVVGLIIGALVALVWYPFVHWIGAWVGAVMAVIAWITVTGGLHLDGLADSCDGVFSGKPKAEILCIMKDSRIGTHGALALIMAILAKTALLASLDFQRTWLFILIIPALARMNTVISAGMAAYSRPEGGLGKLIVDGTRPLQVVIAIIISLMLGAVLVRFCILIMLGCSAGTAVLVTLYFKRKIGGVTGDTLGALIEFTELVLLFVVVLLSKLGVF